MKDNITIKVWNKKLEKPEEKFFSANVSIDNADEFWSNVIKKSGIDVNDINYSVVSVE